jgi:hypothetical protein
MRIESLVFNIVILVFSIVSLFAIFSLKSLYNNPNRITVKTPIWWAYSDKSWIIFARSTPLLTILSPFLPIGAILGEYANLNNQIYRIALFTSAILIALGVPLSIIAAVIGRPKWLIPPHLR